MLQKAKIIVLGSIVALGLALGASPAFAQNLDNFTITNYDVDLYLDKDSQQRSVLKTTETITAQFPPNQNKGIARDFVKDYDDHTVNFELESVTDEHGNDLDYRWNNDTLEILKEGVYVEGAKTYKISYSQRDVTKFYSNTNKIELYWDAIGVEWRVPIEQANVTLRLSPEVARAAASEFQCYRGSSGSNRSCDIATAATRDNPTTIYRAGAQNLQKGEGITIALGFEPGTFAPYERTTIEKIVYWAGVAVVLSNVIIGPIAFAAGVVLLKKRSKRSKADRGVKAIYDRPNVVEYVAPKNRSVLESTLVRSGSIGGTAVGAQLIDWAVRHYLTIRQTKDKTWIRPAEYEFEAKKSFSSLSQAEQTLASALFGGVLPTKGSTVTTKELTKRRMKTAKVVQALPAKLKKSDLFEEDEKAKAYYQAFAKKGFIGFFVLLANLPVLVVAIIAWTLALNASYLLSKKGAELKKYLEGLKEYISVAEQDRLAMLQSPDGAAKVGKIDANDKGALIKLYEKLLPYAILFGQEKQWTKELGNLYEEADTSPDWNTGQTAVNAATLGAMVGGVSSGVASASSYSSSSGGSGGGGSAGGGGGGGGGGGV